MTGLRRHRRARGRGQLRAVLATLALHAAGAAAATSPIRAAPYNPTRILQAPNSSFLYIFSPASGSTSHQGSLRAVPLNGSFTTSTTTATGAQALPGKLLSATLPFLQDGVNIPYTPLLDPTTGALTVLAGPCASGAVGAQLWQFGTSAPSGGSSQNDGSGGTWTPMNTTLGGVSVAGGSTLTNGGSGLSGANFLAGGLTFANSGGAATPAGAGPSYYIFGGMCPYDAQNVAATSPTGWVAEANYYNTMLTLSPAAAGAASAGNGGGGSPSPSDYRLSAVASLGQPIAEAGFTITALTPPGSNGQQFLLLGGHTQAAFLNMSQIALYALPQQTWAFFPVVQPGAAAAGTASTASAAAMTSSTTAKADLRAFRQAGEEKRDSSSSPPPPPAIVEPRSGHTAVLSEDGSCVIVFGGWVGDVSNAAQPQLAILRLGPGYGSGVGGSQSNNWEWTVPESSQGPSLPEGVAGIYGHGATMLPGGVMMVVGGFQIPTETATGSASLRRGKRADDTASGESVLLYNVSSNSWIASYTSPAAAIASTGTISPGSPTLPKTGTTTSSGTAAAAGTTTTQSQQTGLGVGIGLGIFIVVGLILGAFWLARRRREQQQQTEDQRRRDSLTPSSYDGDHHQDGDAMLQGHQYESYLEKSSGDGTPGSGRRVGGNGFFQDRERVASSGHSQRGLGADAGGGGGGGQDAAGVVTPQMAMHPGNGASPVTAGSTGLFVDVPSPTRGLRRGLAGRPYLYHAAPRSSALGIATARPGITTTGTSAANAAAAAGQQQQPHYYGPLLGQNAIHPIVEREDEDDSSSVHRRRRRRHPQRNGDYSDVSDLDSDDDDDDHDPQQLLGNNRRYYSNPPFSPSVASSRQMMEEIERSLAGTPDPGAAAAADLHQPLLLRSPVSPIANPFLDPEVLPLPNPLGSHPLTPRRSPELLPIQDSQTAAVTTTTTTTEEQRMPEAGARVRPLSFVGSSNSSSSNRSGGVTVVPSPLRHNRSDASSTTAVGVGAREHWAPTAFHQYASDHSSSSSVPSSGRTSPTKTLLSDDRTGSTLSERSHRSQSSATSIARTMSTRTGALLCAAAYAAGSAPARKPGSVADKVAAMEERLNGAGGGTTKTVRTTTTTAESVDFDADARTETISSVGKVSSIGKRNTTTPAKQDFYSQNATTPSTAGGGVPLPPAYLPAAAATITAEKSTDSFATARTTFAQLQSEGEALLGGAKPAVNGVGSTTPAASMGGTAAAGGSGTSPTFNRANSPKQTYPPASYDPTAGMHSSSTPGRRHRSGASSNGGGMSAGVAASGSNGGGLWGSGGAGGWVSSLRRALTALSVSERSFSMTSSVVPGSSGEDSHGLLHSGSGGPYSHHRGTSSPLASPTPGSRFHLRPTNNTTPTPASRAAGAGSRGGGLHPQTASSSPTRHGIGGGSKSGGGPRRTVSAGSTLLLKQKRGQKDWSGVREDIYDLDLDAAQHLLRSPIVSPVRADHPHRPATAADRDDDYRDDWGAPRSSFEVRQAESEWDVEGAATGREVQVLSFTVPKARLRVVNADIRAERASLRSLSEGAVSSASGNSRPGSLKRPERGAADAPTAKEKASSATLNAENHQDATQQGVPPARRPSPLSAAIEPSATTTEEHARVPRRLSRVPQVDESQGRRWNRWAGTEAPPPLNGSDLSTVSAPPAAHSISRSPEREKLYRISTSEVGSGRSSPFDKKLL